jgi:hypothetical protein
MPSCSKMFRGRCGRTGWWRPIKPRRRPQNGTMLELEEVLVRQPEAEDVRDARPPFTFSSSQGGATLRSQKPDHPRERTKAENPIDAITNNVRRIATPFQVDVCGVRPGIGSPHLKQTMSCFAMIPSHEAFGARQN